MGTSRRSENSVLYILNMRYDKKLKNQVTGIYCGCLRLHSCPSRSLDPLQ